MKLNISSDKFNFIVVYINMVNKVIVNILQFWTEKQQMIPLFIGSTTVAVLLSIAFVVLMLYRRYIFCLFC